ncbi:MAG TPA: 50S ribosomal protein L5 [bacterium]|nr:50S ribosomal protein L5 [bacterium]
MESRLKQYYKESAIPAFMSKFGLKNTNQVPKLVKIVLNVGIGKDNKDAKILENAQKELSLITGQKPVVTRAKKAISGFNLRKGDICGVFVTLRGERMYEFIDRFVTVALPRVRDFNGLSASSTDGKGSYTIGVREQGIFPEIDYNSIYKVKGMNITIVTNAKNKVETLALLKELGLPIRGE